MQLSVKWLGVLVLSLPLVLWRLEKTESRVVTTKDLSSLSFSQYNRHSLRKTAAPFATRSLFTWVDRASGTGKVQVTVNGESFASSQWSYEWILPNSVRFEGLLNGEFTAPGVNQQMTFELVVSGLDPQANQNLIFNLKPSEGLDQRMALAVPTHPEQTLEAEIRKEYAPEPNFQSMQKSTTAVRRPLPKGIQF